MAGAAEAKVVKVVVESRAPLSGSFGAAGAYEAITGHFFGEIDPKDPKNALITDIQLAPRNARGMVEYSATFGLAKPVDMGKASGFLFYNTPNRGNGQAAGAADGRITLVSGWQGDLPAAPGRQTAVVPIARNKDGSPVTAPVVIRFMNMAKGAPNVLMQAGVGAGALRPAPLSYDTGKARLERKKTDTEPGTVVAGSDWSFSQCAAGVFPGAADPSHVCLKGGFDPAFVYELTYVAKDPPVMGIGLAATRDIAAFFRYGADTPATPNPVAGKVKWAIGTGVSQAGNFIKTFISLGFNQAEDGRIVFDGANPHIAGRQVPLNVRFSLPGGASSLYDAGSESALWWARYDDKTRGQGVTSLLTRCTASKTCPKVFETFGATEFWGLRMSPDLIGTDAKADIPLPANVRRYYFAGTPHGGGGGGFDVLGRSAKGTGDCVLPGNPNPQSEQMRALTQALQDWISKGSAPPPSLYPTLAKGDLVLPTSQHLGFPSIPGYPAPDGRFLPFLDYDFGPGFNRRDLSGVMTKVPPSIRYEVPSMAVKVDADGN
ncbi:alpha/beta hydrolase domain-containing protein [soil metagenome]